MDGGKTDTSANYNPYAERKNPHPITNLETLTHLLRSALGSGILTMPVAFYLSGLVTGLFVSLITIIVCTHCTYVVVQCAQILYHRHQIPQMRYSEVAEVACTEGPPWARKISHLSKYTVDISLFLELYCTCALYMVIVVENIKQIVEFHTGEVYNIRICLLLTLIPAVLFAWIPHIKYLAPFSLVANVFMLVALGIIMYYLCTDLPPISERYLHNTIEGIPPCVAITMFSIAVIGVVMSLENQMKNPTDFIGIFGVLNQGIAGCTIIFFVIGFMGYWKYGADTLGSISLNLPTEDYLAQAVKILIGLAVFLTFGIQFYVCHEVCWNWFKDNFPNYPILFNYVLRTILAIVCVLLAVAVPTIASFAGLIGAIGIGILIIFMPVLLQTIVYWDVGFGRFYWIIWKNIICLIIGIIAIIFGSKSSIEEICKLYQ